MDRKELNIGRVNGSVEADRGRIMWVLMVRPCHEYAAEV